MECSDSDYNSENDPVSELDKLRETLQNHKVEWPKVFAERKSYILRSRSSSCCLAPISESIEENNEEEIESVDKNQSDVETKIGRENDAGDRLEKASKLLDEGKVSILEFLQLLDFTGKWFPKDSKLSFEFEEKNNEYQTIYSIMKEYYGLDWSSPFQFEFNDNIDIKNL